MDTICDRLDAYYSFEGFSAIGSVGLFHNSSKFIQLQTQYTVKTCQKINAGSQ